MEKDLQLSPLPTMPDSIPNLLSILPLKNTLTQLQAVLENQEY